MTYSTTYRRNSMPSQQNKTKKNEKAKLCNVGINGTKKPCCDKNKDGAQCHIRSVYLDSKKRLTRSNSLLLEKEHHDYKMKEKDLFGSSGIIPSKNEISKKLLKKGIKTIIDERNQFKDIVKMRSDWLKKWYIQPINNIDCYVCDANARNHSMRITILKECIKDYDDIIAENERNRSVSSRTRSARSVTNSRMSSLRPKLNITRKKDNHTKVDSITRRQALNAMLAKKRMSQERRKLLSEQKKQIVDVVEN